MQKNRRTSISTLRGTAREGKDKDAEKVLKGLLDVAEATASERDHDVLAAGAGVSMMTDQDRERAPVTPKRWDAMLKRPDLDYSDLFSETTGKLPGLTIWQIENFYPVEIDESQHGQFYKADAYIILKTQWNEMSEMDWEIYFWIGEESTMDKKACAAMHSVHLRNMLGCERRTHREEMGDESDTFVDLFPEITYIEGQDVVYRLFQLQGTKHPFLEPVEMEAESLNLGQVFLLDCGEVIFIWCGSRSSLMSRSKARLLAEKINKFERKGHSKIIQLRPGLEPDQFWHFLGGELEKPISFREYVYVPRRPILYRVGLGTGYLELPQVEVPMGQLKRAILKTSDVYILDCHTDIFVWIGRKSARLVRAAALRMADELRTMLKRPLSALVTRCQQGTEPVIFKTRFVGWEDVVAVDFTRTTDMLEKREQEMKQNPGQDPSKKAAKVDMSPLFLERQPPMPNRDANEIAFQFNRQLVSMRCCIIEGRKFSILPNKEKGHFYSGECYFFLCRYLEDKERDEESGEESGDGEEEEEEEDEVQTVVYFWQGRDASKMGWLHFTLGIQKQLEQAIEGPLDVIHLKQQQEDFRFLSHFGSKFIIHWGRRSPDVKNYQPSLYQIRANQSKLCRRVVQVPATPTSLNSAFCHILKVPFETGGTGIVYIWIGSQATQEEAIHAEQMGRSMFDSTYSNVLVQEGAEPENFFWVALGGRKDYETGDLCNQDVMLMDTGKEVFMWFGPDSTDIEKKLSVKAAQVYIKHLAEKGEGEEGGGGGGKRKVSRVEPRSREYTLDFQSSSCCTIRVDEGETTVRSFLSRLRNDKNLVENAGELELRYVPACHLWLGTVAEFPKLAENERIFPHLPGNGIGKGSLLQPAALPLEAEITNEPAPLTPSEPKRTTTLPLETKVTEPLGLQQDTNGTTLPKGTNRTTAVPTVTQETYKPLTLPQETKGTTEIPQETERTTEPPRLPQETKGTTEPPRLPQETKRTTEPPRLQQETNRTTDLVLSEAAKTKETESDVVMIVSAEGKRGDNEQRKEANGSDSGLNATTDSHSECSVDLNSEEVPMIVCPTVGGVVGGECGEGRDGEVEERERGKGEGGGDKEDEGEEEVGSDEGIGMEVCVGSETGEGGSVIVVIGSEDDEERYQGVSGMEQNPVIHCCGMELSQSDLRTLEPNKCLNDQVVNCYMKLLVKQAVRKPDTVAIASTFFYTKLCRGGFSGVTRWMKNVDFARLRLFLVPVHLPTQQHWCLVAVHIRRRVIEYYDSLGFRNPSCLKRLLKFVLKRTRKRLKHQARRQVSPLQNCHWRKCYPEFARWLCYNHGSSSHSKIPFTQSHMRRLRHVMRMELENERLRSDLTRQISDHPLNF
ncbi:Protein flightless-1 homolog [Geodia barretti]|uniref:Protein flightless-1 homolog n=1 Tax=Geodia barretti TaxID=519541 RepID=A0AA35XAB5_GEOBA|nr:Protein flightless-1 homolog [Geodia barretti]